jgi:hypothetical protein
MATTQQLANSIAQMEGYNSPGTIANRNNNPGNLRYAANQIGSENTINGTFAKFATPQDGWDALVNYINNNSSLTLRDFTYKYAPPVENDTSNFLNYLSGQTGIQPDQQLVGVLDGSYGVSQDWLDSSGGSGDVGSYLSNLSEGLDTTSLIALAGIVVVGLVVSDVF